MSDDGHRRWMGSTASRGEKTEQQQQQQQSREDSKAGACMCGLFVIRCCVRDDDVGMVRDVGVEQQGAGSSGTAKIE